MKEEILTQYKTEIYENLSEEERKNLCAQTIRAIQQEENLTECEIEYISGTTHCGFDYRTSKILIDFDAFENSYDMLCAIIHELRHQWQFEKSGEMPLIGQRKNYLLMPQEKDAYEYSLSKMLEYADFFNDDAFDLNMIELISKYINRRNMSKSSYEYLGYSDNDIFEIATKMAIYENTSAIFSPEEVEENPDVEQPKYYELDSDLAANYCFNETNKNLNINILRGMNGSVIGDELYIRTVDLGDGIELRNFVGLVTHVFFDFIKSFQKMGLDVKIPKTIHFPPALAGFRGMKKDEYDEFLKHLNCDENKTVSLENMKKFDRDYIINGVVNLLQVTDGKNIDFGFNYLDEYTKEQVEVLDDAINWMLDLDDLKEESDTEEEIKGFYAAYQYKKQYSPEKLRLILEAQKQGLNTLYYGNLNESQIKHIMELQLDGAKRSEWIDLIQDKTVDWIPEDSSERPSELPYSDGRIAEGVASINPHELETEEQPTNDEIYE